MNHEASSPNAARAHTDSINLAEIQEHITAMINYPVISVFHSSSNKPVRLNVVLIEPPTAPALMLLHYAQAPDEYAHPIRSRRKY